MIGEEDSTLNGLLNVRNMTVAGVIITLRSINLLKTTMLCKFCNEAMHEREKKNLPDKICWYCLNKFCSKYKTTRSIRDSSFFQKFNHSLSDVWSVVVLWMNNIPAHVICTLYDFEKKYVLRVFNEIRLRVAQDMMANPIKLGGRGIICQIDETHLAFRSKYGVGRQPNRQQWAFGIVDTSFTPAKGYIELVSSRRKEVLLEIISRVCLPNTIIHSDCWPAYRQIQNELGLEHQTVNHKYNFVDPVTGAHTQHIESYWNRIKRKIKAMNGIRRNMLHNFVDEFVWKDFHRERLLHMLVGLLAVPEN